MISNFLWFLLHWILQRYTRSLAYANFTIAILTNALKFFSKALAKELAGTRISYDFTWIKYVKRRYTAYLAFVNFTIAILTNIMKFFIKAAKKFYGFSWIIWNCIEFAVDFFGKCALEIFKCLILIIGTKNWKGTIDGKSYISYYVNLIRAC